MSTDLKGTIAWLAFGAIVGWVYALTMIGFWATYLLQLQKTAPQDRLLVHFVNVVFRPPIYLTGIGLYAIYRWLHGDLTGWFLLGALGANLPTLYYTLAKK